MDKHQLPSQVAQGIFKSYKTSSGIFRALVGVLLRRGLAFARNLITLLTKQSYLSMRRLHAIATALPQQLSKLSDAIGAQWIALSLLLCHSRASCLLKWTQEQLLNFEYSSPDQMNCLHETERSSLSGIFSPSSMAVSVLGGLVR
jgi:hypothetical protein